MHYQIKKSIFLPTENKFIYELNNGEQLIENELLKVNVCFKKKEWEAFNHYIVLPISIHSVIHSGAKGGAKISSFVKSVKYYARNKILILLCDGAHLNCYGAQHQCDFDEALRQCRMDAEKLADRFKKDFQDCEVMYWSELIFENKNYHQFKSDILNLYQSDENFKQILRSDINKPGPIQIEKFFQHAEMDCIELYTALKIMHETGYRTHIYPGRPTDACVYLQPLFYPDTIFVNTAIKTKILA